MDSELSKTSEMMFAYFHRQPEHQSQITFFGVTGTLQVGKSNFFKESLQYALEFDDK